MEHLNKLYTHALQLDRLMKEIHQRAAIKRASNSKKVASKSDKHSRPN